MLIYLLVFFPCTDYVYSSGSVFHMKSRKENPAIDLWIFIFFFRPLSLCSFRCCNSTNQLAIMLQSVSLCFLTFFLFQSCPHVFTFPLKCIQFDNFLIFTVQCSVTQIIKISQVSDYFIIPHICASSADSCPQISIVVILILNIFNWTFFMYLQVGYLQAVFWLTIYLTLRE